jgi:hypothetical protein
MDVIMQFLLASLALPIRGSAFSTGQSHMPTYKFMLDWVPILIFLGLLIFFMTRLMKPQYRTLDQYRIEHIAELRRLNASLERIADVLQTRGENRKTDT